MKKFLLMVVATLVLVGSSSSVLASTDLTDIEGTKYEVSVVSLEQLGLVNGFTDNTYRASEPITRAQMAKLLVISTGLDASVQADTKFDDVSGEHWASGYINMAVDRGYIKGYPDNTFRPDEPINYAEAATMALRALGYESVVENKGTWPTNYIAKAKELKLLDDVTFGTYLDTANRGEISNLIWNMLRTKIWDVDGQSEKSGLSYSQSDLTMIDKYFKDYSYEEDCIFEDFEITTNKKNDVIVKVSLSGDNIKGSYEYNDNDFYKFVEGTEVAVLVKDDVVLSMIINDEEKLDEGEAADLNEDYKGIDVNGDYNYVRIIKKAIVNSTELSISNDYIKEVKETSKYFVATGDSKYRFDEDFDSIILSGDERIDYTEIKEGDVLSTVKVGNEEFYILSRETIKGNLNDIVTLKEDGEKVNYLVINNKKYEVKLDNVIEVVDDEDEETKISAIQNDEDSKFYGEKATLFFNFVGDVVRVEFNEIEDEKDNGDFYVVSNAKNAYWNVSDEDGVVTYIQLNGKKYEVKADVDLTGIKSGAIVIVKFDSKNKVKYIEQIAEFNGINAIAEDSSDLYDFHIINQKYEDKYIGDYKVVSGTTIIRIKAIKDDADDEDLITSYEYEIVDVDDIEGIKNLLVAHDQESDFTRAEYVFVWDDAKNTNKNFGIVEKDSYNKDKNGYSLVIDDEQYYVEDGTSAIEQYEGMLVSFIENDDEIEIIDVYSINELLNAGVVSGDQDEEMVKVDVNGSILKLDLDNLDLDDDCRIFFVEVEENEDDELEFTSWKETSIEKLNLKDGDRIAIQPNGLVTIADIEDKAEIIIIVREK